MSIVGGLKDIADNPYFIIVASLASIFGLLLGLTVIFPPKKKPFYLIKSFNLIKGHSSTINNLDIKYKFYDDEGKSVHEEIKSLTTSKILFWNGGRKIINYTDIADSTPLRIVSKKAGKILEANIIQESISNPATNINVEPKTNIIYFEFLEPTNGAVIEVLHTGLSSKEIFIEGYIKNSDFNGRFKLQGMPENNEALVVSLIGVIAVILSSIIYIFPPAFFSPLKSLGLDFPRLLPFVIIVYSIVAAFSFSQSNFFFSKKLRIPKISLQIFNGQASK